MKPDEETARAWVQARVNEHHGVDAARPEGFSTRAWRQLCDHYKVRYRRAAVTTLEDALRAVAELAKP